jgi:hypothetical protein
MSTSTALNHYWTRTKNSRTLRDTGPVVRLERLNVYAVSRYRDVKQVLSDANAFRSGNGVALNDFANTGSNDSPSARKPADPTI